MPHHLRDGTTVEDRRLDRLRSATAEHLERYPLTAATMPTKPSSMACGINWYSNFDQPVQRVIGGVRRWVIGHGDLGRIRGGHATTLRHETIDDSAGWHEYYNQRAEGRCVEFTVLRVLSHLNRKRYDITSRWHYWMAQQIDEWQGGSYPGGSPAYEGTSVRAGLEIASTFGAIIARRSGAPITYTDAKPQQGEGIGVYRWAHAWQDVRAALGTPDDLPGVRLLNSWGRDYPREVLLLDEAGERVLAEDGEFGIVTDR